MTTSDLSTYVTSSSLTSTLASYITSSSLTSTLASYVTNSSLTSTLASYVTNSSLTTTLNNYITNSSLTTTLLNYASKSIENTYTALQTFNSGITVTGDSSFGDVSGNFFPTRPAFINITALGSAVAPTIIPMQTAMISYISNNTSGGTIYVKLTINPDAKYVGQTWKFYNSSANGFQVLVGASNYIMGAGLTWTLNTLGSVAASTKNTFSITYIGSHYQNAPSFLFSTGL